MTDSEGKHVVAVFRILHDWRFAVLDLWSIFGLWPWFSDLGGVLSFGQRTLKRDISWLSVLSFGTLGISSWLLFLNTFHFSTIEVGSWIFEFGSWSAVSRRFRVLAELFQNVFTANLRFFGFRKRPYCGFLEENEVFWAELFPRGRELFPISLLKWFSVAAGRCLFSGRFCDGANCSRR